MPIFAPRNRVEILRDMIARVVARSGLVGLTRNSVVYHVLAAAAGEDAEQYFQMARLRELFSIDKATGSDLDERAAEILPASLSRYQALYATTDVIYSRPGIVGSVTIAAGSLVGASDSDGQIRYRTTAAGSILVGATVSAPIPVVALEAGARANVAAGEINQMVTRIAGATGVTNAAKVTNGQDRESDARFRARLKNFVQAISRGTPTAIESFSRNVIMTDGTRVVFAKLTEPVIPNGQVQLYIDNGSGTAETYSSTYIGSPDTLLTALGGEKTVYTTQKPIRDDGSFALYVNAVLQVRNTDYYLNTATGQVDFSTTSYPTGLTVGDVVTANYRYYTGLIQEVQRVIDGDPLTPLTRPGVRAGGIQVFVLAATPVSQSVDASIAVLDGFDTEAVAAEVSSAIQDYINTLDIGEDVIMAKIVEVAMSVTGMFNFRLNDLTGTSPAVDQTILPGQVARITAANITLT